MSKYTKSAQGKECTVRLPGICNFNPETTVAAHKNGAGWAIKYPDIMIAYACSDCHEWLDGGYVRSNFTKHDRDAIHNAAIIQTQMIMIEDGILEL